MRASRLPAASIVTLYDAESPRAQRYARRGIASSSPHEDCFRAYRRGLRFPLTPLCPSALLLLLTLVYTRPPLARCATRKRHTILYRGFSLSSDTSDGERDA